MVHVYKNIASNIYQISKLKSVMSHSAVAVLSLLVATTATGGLGSTMSCQSQCSVQLSLYQQQCCNISNYGQVIRMTEGERHQYLLCPTTRPRQCISSCSDVLNSGETTSGYYNIYLADGSITSVYCNMEGCDGEGGWTRVAYLNMSDPSEECPTELRLYNESEVHVRVCGRQHSSGASCDSVTFSTYGVNYSQVCGRVRGYQFATPEGFFPLGGDDTIDSPYVDGISITHGSPPRQHIWSLTSGYRDSGSYIFECPCNTGSTATVPSFVGDNYFCESGNPLDLSFDFFLDDPLWDGKGCGGAEGPCCNASGIPWFHSVLDSPTSDFIELRVCADQDTSNEDTPVDIYEIYVK